MRAFKLSITIFLTALIHGNGEVYAGSASNNIYGVTTATDVEGNRIYGISDVEP